MSALKKIWVEHEEGCWPTVMSNEHQGTGTQYIRADLVDGLVDSVNRFKGWAESQHKAQSKGAHETFDMLMLRNQVEMAETALAALKELEEE
jgi:hypothetical protein